MTTRGAIKKANRAVQRELERAAEEVARAYGSGNSDSAVGVMSWQVAEALVRDWMKQNGYRDARLTASGPDGGVDVVAAKAVSQVKHHANPVRLHEVQRIFGIAAAERKKALIFGSAGFTPAAQAWAEKNGIECYRFPPVRRMR